MSIVYVQDSKLLNGVLRFSSLTVDLYKSGFIDKMDTLRSVDRLPEFLKYLAENGLELQFEDGYTREKFEKLQESTTRPFEVNSPFLVENKLFPFQNVGLNIVWEKLKTDSPRVLVQWDTGAGKTLLSCLIAQRLFDEDKIDKVLIFCKKIKQDDWITEFKRMTTLDVEKVGSQERSKRHAFYDKDTSQVLVLNYEKARGPSRTREPGSRTKVENFSKTDLQKLLELAKDKRVLVVIDEAQKINTGSSLLSSGFERLLNGDNDRVMALALTATPYTTSPLNIRNILDTVSPGIPGVSDLSRDGFKRYYGKELVTFNPTPWVHELYVKEWDRAKLPLLGKKHEQWTHIAMKSDPQIASQFPETTVERLTYELSSTDREIYDWAEQVARSRYNPDNPNSSNGYINTLRMICNTTAGLLTSEGHFAKEIVEQFGGAISHTSSSKYQLLECELETIFESNEKAVAFTFWTNGTLFPYLKALKERFGKDVPIYPIWGVGMTQDEVNKNIKGFNNNPGPALLLSSDIGQEGLNLYCPYLYNIEVPRTYTEFKQRNNRISRADSKSKGIEHTWIYRPVGIDTIEERVDAKVILRREEAEAIRGVVDEDIDMHSTIDMSPKALLFGD